MKALTDEWVQCPKGLRISQREAEQPTESLE